MNLDPQKSQTSRLSGLGHFARYSWLAQKFDFIIKGNFHVSLDGSKLCDFASKFRASSRPQIKFKWNQTMLVII